MMNFSTFLGKEKETFESRKKQNFKPKSVIRKSFLSFSNDRH